MDGLSWLEYSLQQSLRQAFEVLERSSRRVNWSDRPRKFAPLPSNGPKATAALEEAFSSIRDFMNYYDSEGCTDGTVIEQRHGERYHKKIHPTSKSTSRQHQGQVSAKTVETKCWLPDHIPSLPASSDLSSKPK
ncbi:A-kinase-interacting protein 1 isoform X4 [Stigmatopora nigra]